MTSIPIVDFSPYSLKRERAVVDMEVLKSIAEQLCHALSDTGFVYLKNHGIDKSDIESMFSITKEFFEKPNEVKKRYAKRKDAKNNHGWVARETESLNPERTIKDYKETFDYQLQEPKETLPVDIIPTFDDIFGGFYVKCRELALRVMDLLSIGLNIDESFFRDRHFLIGKKRNPTALRSVWYPSITNELKPGQTRCGEHLDYSTVTLLFQDDVGGLEVKPRSCDDYIPAPPIPGTIIINLGDSMQRWTADKLVAGKHRVPVPVEEVKRKQGRQSIGFFVHADDEVILECIDNSNKYEPISSIDYLQMKFNQVY